MEHVRTARNVAILIYDQVEVLDFTGPFEVFLTGSNKGKLTTNRLAIQELRDVMTESAEIFEEARYIDNGKIILSAGISAGIDMSLYVVGRLLGEERAVQTAQLMEYDWTASASFL